MSIDQLVAELSACDRVTTSKLAQSKIKRAFADIRRARTLLEKSELTLSWVKRDCERSKS